MNDADLEAIRETLRPLTDLVDGLQVEREHKRNSILNAHRFEGVIRLLLKSAAPIAPIQALVPEAASMTSSNTSPAQAFEIRGEIQPQPRRAVIILAGAAPLGTLVTIWEDGAVEFGPDYTPERAARVFWDEIGFSYSNTVKDLNQKVRELSEEIAALKAAQTPETPVPPKDVPRVPFAEFRAFMRIYDEFQDHARRTLRDLRTYALTSPDVSEVIQGLIPQMTDQEFEALIRRTLR
jgi:hypothetical protein